MKYSVVFTFFLLILCSATAARSAANVTIDYSQTNIALGEEFCITLTVNGERIKQISSFPEINDWEKSTTLYQKEKNVYTVKQYYKPRIKGVFELANFSMTINNEVHDFKGTILKVRQNLKKATVPKPNAEVSYEESPPMCELIVKVNKNPVFYSESTTISVIFRILETNTAELNFIDLQQQLKTISNQIRHQNLWVHDLSSLKELKIDTSTAFNKANPTYILYKGYISCLDTGSIVIPSLNFNILKYNIFKSPLEVKRKTITYSIQSKSILLKSLPLPSTLDSKWRAGQFRMDEFISRNPYLEQKALYYTIQIATEGIASTIPEPVFIPNEKFNIFTPKISEEYTTGHKNIVGKKIFKYTIISTTTGTIALSDYIYWIYFNTKTNKIDTLKPSKTITVAQNNKSKKETVNKNAESWQSLIDDSSDKIYNLEQDKRLRWISNILIFIMLIITIYIIFKK